MRKKLIIGICLLLAAFTAFAVKLAISEKNPSNQIESTIQEEVSLDSILSESESTMKDSVNTESSEQKESKEETKEEVKEGTPIQKPENQTTAVHKVPDSASSTTNKEDKISEKKETADNKVEDKNKQDKELPSIEFEEENSEPDYSEPEDTEDEETENESTKPGENTPISNELPPVPLF